MPADAARSVGLLERVLALRGFPGLAQVDPTNLALLAEVAEERVFPKGARVLSRGEPVRAMHLIRQGEVAIVRNGVPLRKYAAGDIIGSIHALTRDPPDQDVVATSEIRTFEIQRDDLEEVFEESFQLLYAALRGMQRGILQTRLKIPSDAGFLENVTEGVRPPSELGLVERVLFVRRLLTFGGGRVEPLAELARELRPLRAATGTELWKTGDVASHALLLYSGVVECVTPVGQRFRLGPDSVVGGIDSIAGEPRWFRAVAETEVVALRSDVAHLIDVIEDHPDLGVDMVRAAARILAELHVRVDQLTLESRG